MQVKLWSDNQHLSLCFNLYRSFNSVLGRRSSVFPVFAVRLLGLLAKIKVSGVLPAHIPLVLDAGTVLVSVPMLHKEVGSIRQYTQ